MVRRYCVHNSLRYLWTLTWARQDHDRSAALRDVQNFARRLQRHLGTSIPYLYVLETHKSGAWHAHIALPVWIWHGDLERIWTHGYVSVTDHAKRTKRRVMDREGQGMRRVAGYVAKYVSKAYGAGDGRQGYGVAEGHQPPSVLVWGMTERDVREFIDGIAAHELVVLDLTELDGYEGPPAYWARWGP